MTDKELDRMHKEMHIQQMQAEERSWKFAGKTLKILIGIAVVPWIVFIGILLFAMIFG